MNAPGENLGERGTAGRIPYHHLGGLIRRDWAWEFLRRNRDFRKIRGKVAANMRVDCAGNVSTVSIQQSHFEALKKWGCLFCDTPDEAAPKARVIWDPLQCADIIEMFAHSQTMGLDWEAFDIAAIHCPATMCVTSDGKQHLLFKDKSQTLQLAVTGAGLSEPVYLFSPVTVPRAMARRHLRGLECFQHLQSAGRLLTDYCAAERTAPRLRFVLQALDGHLAGASHREIAIASFGEKRTAADWNNPGRHLQDQVRRAIKRGRDLMDGGYRSLLT